MNPGEAREVAVGDRLWLVETRGRTPVGRAVTVSKIGRKWVSLVDAGKPTWNVGRFDKVSWAFDNGGYSGGSTVYLSEEEYAAKVALDQAWFAFERLVRDSWTMPKHLTIADIQTMTRILQENRDGE